MNLAHLEPHVRTEVFNVLEPHGRMWDGHLGTIAATRHRIDLQPGAPPVYSQLYRAGKRARKEKAEEIDRMLRICVIEPASSEWASPMVLVPKADGALSRRLSVQGLWDHNRSDISVPCGLSLLERSHRTRRVPLPRMDNCIDSLGDAKIFTTLDCNSGYWQICTYPRDRDKTTFTSHYGTYRFKRMPFGLKNAPATFHRVVDIILAGVKWQHCFVYLDDVIVFSNEVESHLRHLDKVLRLLGDAGISLKLKKCQFFKESVDYLGHVIRSGRLELAEKNTRALREAKHPSMQTELLSFLGMCNVYRRFVPAHGR